MVRFQLRAAAWLAVFAVGAFWAASTQAGFAVGSSVFSEEFKGTSLDSDKWDATVGGSGAITVGGGVAAFVTGAADTAYMGSRGSLDFSSSPDNWGAEIKFQVNGVYSSWEYRNYVLLDGLTTATTNGWTNQGFDLRLIRQDSTHFNLGWNGWDNDEEYRQPTILGEGYEDGISHVAQVHRKTDGTVDIYMDGTLIGKQTLINGVNPTMLRIGDITGSVEGNIALDYVRIGAVPEPSTIVLCVMAIIGLLAYAWQRRK